MKKVRNIMLISLGLLIFLSVGAIIYMMQGQKDIEAYDLHHIDLSMISDGSYVGVYQKGRWTNEVEVTVENHVIIEVKVIKTVLFEREEITQDIIEKVLENQSFDIDITVGATITTKAYLIAIEDALDS